MYRNRAQTSMRAEKALRFRSERKSVEKAQELNSMIPVKWQQIKLKAEIGEDSETSYFYFLKEGETVFEPGDDIYRRYPVDRSTFKYSQAKIFRAIRELSNNYISNGQEKWTTMTFTVDCKGHFKTDFEYINLDDSTEMGRRKEWKAKYLNIT